MEYTYADGTKLIFDGRCMPGCADIYKSFLHGSKGSAIVSGGGDSGGALHHVQGSGLSKPDMVWESKIKADERDPYLNEWNDLVDAIRNDKPYSEVKRGVQGSLVTSMGRMAAHTGQEITFNEMLNCKQSSPRRQQADQGRPRAVGGRRQRQVSGAAAGRHHAAGVLYRLRHWCRLCFSILSCTICQSGGWHVVEAQRRAWFAALPRPSFLRACHPDDLSTGTGNMSTLGFAE